MPKKGRLGQFAYLRDGGLGKKEGGGVFEGGVDTLMYTMAFNWSGATGAISLDISKAFGRIWHADLLHKLKSYGI